MAVVRTMPRVHEIIMPKLRTELPGVQIVSWLPDLTDRVYPILKVRRLSGIAVDPKRLDRAVVELTVFHNQGIVEAEDLYLDARQVIWEMWDNQTVTPAGHIHSFFETMGPTQMDSPFDDVWRVQGLIQLGIRPPRN